MVQISRVLLALAFILSACSKDLLTELPSVDSERVPQAEFRVVSYNIHGGKGPNGEGNFGDNLSDFRAMLQDESILCFQEVEPNCWIGLKTIFSDYPHSYYVEQRSTKFGTNLAGGNAIFSKFPISAYDHALVNTDPGGDKWQRKAQYIKMFVGNEMQYVNLFHYHNTYNWQNNDSEAEKQGFRNFLSWVVSKDISSAEMTVLIGDFNLSASQCNKILTNDYPDVRVRLVASNWVDHIFTNGAAAANGIYQTRNALLSDHNAVWGLVCNQDC